MSGAETVTATFTTISGSGGAGGRGGTGGGSGATGGSGGTGGGSGATGGSGGAGGGSGAAGGSSGTGGSHPSGKASAIDHGGEICRGRTGDEVVRSCPRRRLVLRDLHVAVKRDEAADRRSARPRRFGADSRHALI
jgi:hypothetical protein